MTISNQDLIALLPKLSYNGKGPKHILKEKLVAILSNQELINRMDRFVFEHIPYISPHNKSMSSIKQLLYSF